jgi:hypothetical protein
MSLDPPSDQQKPLAEGVLRPDVPVFNCIVYIQKTPRGVHLHVANLAGIDCDAANEREGLAKIVSQFKQHTSEFHAESSTIPWIDPVPPPRSDEQTRFIPVHL